MNEADTIKAAKLALKKTKDGALSWGTTDGRMSFKIDFAKSSLVSWHENGVFGFVVLNSRGEPIGRLKSTSTDDEEIRSLLQDLHKSIEESYLQIDETMRDVFEGLEGKSKPVDDEPPF